MLGSENKSKSESEISDEIHKEFNRGGTRLFKNVTGNFWTGKLLGFKEGVARLANASRVATGVGGVGGSDRIGGHQIIITPEMVGKKIFVFAAIELKRERGGTASDEQENFVDFVNNMGGISGFARSVEQVKNIFDNYLKKLQS